MAIPAHFQLFPPPVPRIAVPNPHSKKPSLSRAFSLAETMAKTEHGDSVIIHVSEARNTSQPQSTQIHPRTSPGVVEHDTLPSPSIDGHPSHHSPQIPPPAQPNFSRPSQLYSPPLPPPPPTRSMSTSQIQKSTTSQTSPVVPIRSMFPTYNPSIPLSKQSYHPQRTTSLPRQVFQRDEYSPRLATPSRLDDAVGGIKTAPSSIINFPTELPRGNRYSSYRELERLWEATNGQEPSAVQESFDLEMARLNEATFTFGSDPLAPFYTMQTYDTNEISISRTNPAKRGVSVDILLVALEPAARRLPPHDGLVTFLFPKLAAMLAIDQSTELARLHHLAPTHKDEMQAAAVQRAANQEACRLFWKQSENRYELEHPAIGRDVRDPNFAISPIGPPCSERPVLHITVSSHSLRSPMSTTYSPPVIFVTNPIAASAPSSAHNSVHAGIRMSTLPQSDIDSPLASLDLGTMTLHISAREILTLMPSLYAIDSIIAAMLAVAVADEATNPIMAAMDIWMPRPKAPASNFGGSVKSYSGSTYYATIAERGEAEDEARLMKQVHSKDKQKGASETEKKNKWFGKQPKEKKGKKKQIVIGEFDLEKLGHYQAGERQGEELPGLTRSTLSALIWGLKAIVWFLTIVVQLLVWILVNVSRAVTSEKF